MTKKLNVDQMIGEAATKLDLSAVRQRYNDQEEFIVLENFIPQEIIREWERELDELKPHIHRNFIPRHKKGGSVAYETLSALAPHMDGVYHSPCFIEFLQRLVEAEIQQCPDSDPHRCALYCYTEAGDHIGFHYDTSYYKDRRWTVLLGFKDQSSSRLVCHLHTRNPGREVEKLELQIKPGMLVVFNGDKLYHAVTPLKEGEHRFIISMQYVTTVEMNPFLRFVSDMKDAIAYFGLKDVFFGGGKRKKALAAGGQTATAQQR